MNAAYGQWHVANIYYGENNPDGFLVIDGDTATKQTFGIVGQYSATSLTGVSIGAGRAWRSLQHAVRRRSAHLRLQAHGRGARNRHRGADEEVGSGHVSIFVSVFVYIICWILCRQTFGLSENRNRMGLPCCPYRSGCWRFLV